jgi:hypothetical protein
MHMSNTNPTLPAIDLSLLHVFEETVFDYDRDDVETYTTIVDVRTGEVVLIRHLMRTDELLCEGEPTVYSIMNNVEMPAPCRAAARLRAMRG